MGGHVQGGKDCGREQAVEGGGNSLQDFFCFQFVVVIFLVMNLNFESSTRNPAT